MGLADALLKEGVKYGSDESLEWIDNVYSFIRDTAYDESVELAKENEPAPGYDKDKFLNTYFVKQLPQWLRDKIRKYGIRNLAILTQAPTGSTGMLAGVSSGIEPNFNWEYIRDDALGKRTIKHWLIEQEDYNTDKLPEYFVTAQELAPKEHVKVQSRIQKYLDSSISKTVNAPNDHKVEDVKEIYMDAYDLGCKGITYYRNGSRQGVLQTEDEQGTTKEVSPDKRPETTDGTTTCEYTGCGKIYLTLNVNGNKEPIETFINSGSDGGCSILYQGLSRMISLSLRSGVSVENVIEQLKSVDSCPSCLYKLGKDGDVDGASCPHIIGGALESITNKEVVVNEKDKPEQDYQECPECGEKTLRMEEGCMSCPCGYSKCG